eukprot:3824729-Pyramimonas_sp.AAC.1
MRCPLGYYSGRAFPPGASYQSGTVNFALASNDATAVSLVLFADGDHSAFPQTPFRPRRPFTVTPAHYLYCVYYPPPPA